MNNEFHSNSRSGYRAKRKKTNLILNGLIVIVLLLIIFVAYTIFSSPGSNKAASKKENQVTAEKTTKQKDNENKAAADQAQTSDTNSQGDQQSQDNQDNQDSSTTNNTDQSQAVVQSGGSSPNVIKTIENPAWKPVGTTQTGEHTPVYDQSSVDWQEMLNAISYATGLEQTNMIVHFLGRDHSTTNASIGTVFSKDKQQIYRVYIKWVDGQGWEPTKVEELSSIQ